ncbi:MAG: hypothetical protein OXQ89_18930 [Rhodospirillaceae bacterium]|nr:hypothetical protein [Rhodospirillaceae bacterium]
MVGVVGETGELPRLKASEVTRRMVEAAIGEMGEFGGGGTAGGGGLAVLAQEPGGDGRRPLGETLGCDDGRQAGEIADGGGSVAGGIGSGC